MASVSTRKSPKQRTFAILFNIQGTEYKVFPLPCDPAIGHKAFRFAKQAGDGEAYDLYADPVHGLTCQCKGFLRWGHCKHCQTLQAAERVFALAAPVSTEPAEAAEPCPF